MRSELNDHDAMHVLLRPSTQNREREEAAVEPVRVPIAGLLALASIVSPQRVCRRDHRCIAEACDRPRDHSRRRQV